MSDSSLASLSPDLQAHLSTLRNLSSYGVLALDLPGQPALYVWWGDRSQALAATSRLAYGINLDLDGDDEDEEEDPEDDAQFDLFAPAQPHHGQYL